MRHDRIVLRLTRAGRVDTAAPALVKAGLGLPQILVDSPPVSLYLALLLLERALLGLLGRVAVEEQLLDQVIVSRCALLVAAAALNERAALLEHEGRGRLR